MSDPDLTDLSAFAAVAEARSFRQAARLRSVAPSSLSDAVKRLEAQLGVRLFNRTTRSVTLTEAGERLLQRLLPALRDISGALDAVNDFRDTPVGTLRLNVPVIVAHTVLPQIAARFLLKHPGITLDVTATDAFIDVLAAGYDAGIRYEESVERDMIAIPIGPRRQRFAAAASPAYLAAHGVPQHPRDLARHACIRHRFDSGRVGTWEFERGDEVIRVTPDGPLIATEMEMERAAAVAGLGIIVSFEDYLVGAIADGTLVPILRDWCADFSGPYLYYASRRHMPAPLRAFIDFIKSQPTD